MKLKKQRDRQIEYQKHKDVYFADEESFNFIIIYSKSLKNLELRGNICSFWQK